VAVKAILEEAMDIQNRADLQGPEHKSERFQATRQLIAANFLTEWMARESLQGHWESVTEEERTEFQEIFTYLFQESYTTMVLNFLKEETIEYSAEEAKNGKVEVRTVIMRANEHIPVDYYVVQEDKGWFIDDVVIDGVSIVGNYRNAFNRVIVNESFEGLLKRMRIQKQAIAQ
jgi:phospholipid transport system substrate-binding protein